METKIKNTVQKTTRENTIAFRMNDRWNNELKRIANEKGVTVSEYVRMVIVDHLLN